MAQARDPVRGMMIDEKDAAGRSEHQGNHYYFCSQECKATFDRSPAKYAGKA